MNIPYLNYGFALINALVVAKVILIGEYAHLGKKLEDGGSSTPPSIKRFYLACWCWPFTPSRKRSSTSCMEKV